MAFQHDDDLDTINTTRKFKKVSDTHQKLDNNDCYVIPVEFLEKLNNQNKVIWKNQLKQEKKLDEISQILRKMHREDTLVPAFFEVNIIFRKFMDTLKLLSIFPFIIIALIERYCYNY